MTEGIFAILTDKLEPTVPYYDITSFQIPQDGKISNKKNPLGSSYNYITEEPSETASYHPERRKPREPKANIAPVVDTPRTPRVRKRKSETSAFKESSDDMFGDEDDEKEMSREEAHFCKRVISLLMKHELSWPFNQPVDPVALGIPDYFRVIKKPMDFRTIKIKFFRDEYKDKYEFEHDVRLVFVNAMTFNPPGSDVYIMAQKLSDFFEELSNGNEPESISSAKKRKIPKESQIESTSVSIETKKLTISLKLPTADSKPSVLVKEEDIVPVKEPEDIKEKN